ncbi:DNA polymerase III beta subunit [Mucinivorans hirudinis]|uniref:Beta sliding clamp n=1 Tax=Mucinivorans hirudinis TaxID=1433126 RepID=A0A060RBB1_9BACT|nr:DNA polymerase III beta subunit [Mucinivorans hirudinis]
MKFTISSSLLSSNLQTVGKVISSKNTLPILDYFLFELVGNQLRITASDMETMLVATLEVENEGADGSFAVPAKRITDSIKEFSEQPLTISVDAESWEVQISWKSGKLAIPGVTGMGYPEAQKLDQEKTALEIKASVFADGITSTIFATADDQLRPVMNGVNIALSSTEITFVATDAHRLVCLQNRGVTVDEAASFILPAKPANLLKSILPKGDEVIIGVDFDSKNVIFTLPKYCLVCRLIEGSYPNYNAVIPKSNNNILIVDRAELMAAIKRVSVCASQASGLLKLSLTDNNLNVSAQDLDYATSAEDNIPCQYEGAELEIGFKAAFLIDILTNLHCTEVEIKLADSTRPGLFIPVESFSEQESLLMLLMPMMIN